MTENEAPVSLGNDDFDAIQNAVMETARGRWFLAEFAKRNRVSDTGKVLEAVERLEGLMKNGRIVTGPDALQAELVTLTARIAQAKMEIVAHASGAQNQEDMVRIAVRALHRVEGRVTGIAEDLRRSASQLENPQTASAFLLGAHSFLKTAPLAAPAIAETFADSVPAHSGNVENRLSAKDVAAPKPEARSFIPLAGASDGKPASGRNEEPVSVSAARLSALEELANRALLLKKAQVEAAQSQKKALPLQGELRSSLTAADTSPAVASPRPSLPPRAAPLMEPPPPVNDDASQPNVAAARETTDKGAFNPDWGVRSSMVEKDEGMPMPQVAVAGQARSPSMLARSAPVPTSFFASERRPDRPVIPPQPERHGPFATLAAASKAIRATQAMAERVREQEPATVHPLKTETPKPAAGIDEPLRDGDESPQAETAPVSSERKQRFSQHWDTAFSTSKRIDSVQDDGVNKGVDLRVQPEKATPSLAKNGSGLLSTSVSAPPSSLSIRTIDALSFEDKAVYFS